MELFTFVQMHGAVTAPEHVDILPIGGAGATLETVAGWFSNFRGERAKCFKPSDRAMLLGRIRDEWGSEEAFDKFVHTELREVMVQSKAQYQRRMKEVAAESVDLLFGD